MTDTTKPATDDLPEVTCTKCWQTVISSCDPSNKFGGCPVANKYANRRPAATPAATDERELIRRTFLAHGFTIKTGCDDLKPYVYEAAEALLAARAQLAAPIEVAIAGSLWHVSREPDGHPRVECVQAVYPASRIFAPTASQAGRDALDAEGDYQRIGLLEWAVARWRDEVQHRPLVNVHRRTLDDTWRQVMRHAGGNPDELVGLSHDELLAGGPIAKADRAALAGTPGAPREQQP